jgi:hypothetical protein
VGARLQEAARVGRPRGTVAEVVVIDVASVRRRHTLLVASALAGADAVGGIHGVGEMTGSVVRGAAGYRGHD